MMAIILQHINVLKQAVHLKFTQLHVNYTPIKLGKNKHTYKFMHTHTRTFLFSLYSHQKIAAYTAHPGPPFSTERSLKIPPYHNPGNILILL